MKSYALLVILLASVMADDNFLEKKKQLTLKNVAEIFSINKKGEAKFLAKSTDESYLDSLKELVDTNNNYAAQLLGAEENHEVTFVQSEYLVNEENPNDVRADNSKVVYFTAFDTLKPEKDLWSSDEVKHFKEDCIYVFSDCGFKGNHMKSCSSHQLTFASFPFDVASVKVPAKASLMVAGDHQQIAFVDSMSCLTKKFSFLTVDGIELTYPNGEKLTEEM